MSTPQELCEIALSVPGPNARIVIMESTSTASLRWARSMLTTNGDSRSNSLTVISIVGDRYASGSISAPDPDRTRDLVARLDAECASARPARDAEPLVSADGAPDRSWSDPAAITEGTMFAGIARQLGDWFADPAVEHFGYAEQQSTTTWLATSTGIRRRHVQPNGRLEGTAKSHGRTRSAWWGVSVDYLTGLDLQPGRRSLADGLERQSRRIEVTPGRRDVVLTPSAVGDLMVDLWWSSVAQDALEGRNVFSRPDGGVRLGERIADPRVSLSSDPDDIELATCPFAVVPVSSAYASVFDSGSPLGHVDWIRDGVLAALIGPRATARETGLPVCLSPGAIRLEAGGEGDLTDLVANVTDGLLITCLWYNRLVDPQTLLLTGLTRDGVYVIRNGEIAGVAGNYRFNDSPVGVLDRIAAASRSHRTLPREFGDYAHRVAMPALHVTDFNLSTRSDAL